MTRMMVAIMAVGVGALLAGCSAIVGAECAAGFERCGARCFDLASDPLHCGACDHACASGMVCEARECVAGIDGGVRDGGVDAGDSGTGDAGLAGTTSASPVTTLIWSAAACAALALLGPGLARIRSHRSR